MHFDHTRTQHPVGQGFFHTALLATQTSSFRYVYDCGSSSDRVTLNGAIDAYRQTWPASEQLDLLCLSHAHNDHINGLTRLLEDRAVDTVMLPLLSHGERLAALARSMASAPAGEDIPFLIAFTADPERALAERFRPNQILLVSRGRSSGRAPDGDDPPVTPGPGDGRSFVGEGWDATQGWRLVGPGRVAISQLVIGDQTERRSLPLVARITDRHGLLIDERERWGSWMFATYINPEMSHRRKQLILDFRARLRVHGCSAADLNIEALLSMVVHRRSLTELLVDVYKKSKINLNEASLCLYSGPATPSPHPSTGLTIANKLAFDSYWGKRERRVAWLGTGDAMLKGERRIEALTQHYAAHVDRIGTMTLPHHGSDKNVDQCLIDRIGAKRHVVSAREDSKHHPGQNVIKLFEDKTVRWMDVVTEDPETICVEAVA